MMRPLSRVCLPLLALGALMPAAYGGSDSPGFAPAEGSAVHWAPWDAATLARARSAGRPLYVLIGSGLSELSRATLKSLETPETAAFFNAHFICVCVDREARPDLAAAGQFYLAAAKQAPGWPVSLWMTPEGQPYDGANYLPPSEEWGKKSLMEIAQRSAEAWGHDPAGCRRAVREGAAQMRRAIAAPSPAGAAVRTEETREGGAQAWRALYDAAHGGFGDPPRSPQPELLRFLIARGGADRDLALADLRQLAAGALRDPLDGGFFRSTQDPEGRIPYPQKVLGDQARLALAYLAAETVHPEPIFAGAARGCLDYVLHRLALPNGAWAEAEDGTREGREGYFAWTAAEITADLGPADAPAFDAAYGVEAGGNVSADADPSGQFSGKNLLRRVGAPGTPAEEARLAADAGRLLARRDARGTLWRDERSEAMGTGLLLAALAQAGETLREPRFRSEAIRLGREARIRFVGADGAVRHFAGGLPDQAGPADAAALALGYQTLGRIHGDRAAIALAAQLLATASRRYLPPGSGQYAAAALPLAAGIFVRAPAHLLADDGLEPEALALLAQPGRSEGAALVRGLVQIVADQERPSGGALLALETEARWRAEYGPRGGASVGPGNKADKLVPQ